MRVLVRVWVRVLVRVLVNCWLFPNVNISRVSTFEILTTYN